MSNTVNTTITEKTIQTRLINRHDSLTNWENSNLILKPGEIALAYVETAQPKIDPETNEPLTDGRGNVINEMVPNYLMKIGVEGKTFKELSWLAAPASDVYAWAKKAEFDYKDSTELESLIEYYNKVLTGIGDTEATPSQPANVLNAIWAAINTLDSTDSPEEGEISLAVVQTDGKVAVTYGKISDANIADDANILMSKVENLTQIHNDIYGYTAADGSSQPGIKSKVEHIINELGDGGKIMEFIGVSSTDPSVDDGKGVITIDGNTVTDFEAGDTVVYGSTGKEFIYYNGVWNEIGYASDVYTTLNEFAKRVLNGGLSSTRLGENDALDDTETLEAEFLRRTLALEEEVGITDDQDEDTKSLRERTEEIENTLTEKVPQFDSTNNVLTINSEVLIFDCGTATPRSYLNEKTQSAT